MTDVDHSDRRQFLKATGGLMAAGLSTSLAGCSSIPGMAGSDNESAKITGNVSIADGLQESVEVVTHEPIVNKAAEPATVGVYVELANNGSEDKMVNIVAKFSKNGSNVGQDDGQGSTRIPAGKTAKLRYSIAGDKSDITSYDVNITSAY